jgi:hypothetical protein
MKNNVSRIVGDAATVSCLVKNTKTNTLRAQQAAARFGKSARHPLCLAALDLWSLDAELSRLMEDAVLFEKEVLNSAKQQRKQVIKLYHESRNAKEASEASVLLRKIKEFLSGAGVLPGTG